MSGTAIYLYGSAANPNDIILRDPTVLVPPTPPGTGGATGADTIAWGYREDRRRKPRPPEPEYRPEVASPARKRRRKRDEPSDPTAGLVLGEPVAVQELIFIPPAPAGGISVEMARELMARAMVADAQAAFAKAIADAKDEDDAETLILLAFLH